MRGRVNIGSVEEGGDKNANMAMDVPIEEEYEEVLTEAWDEYRWPRTRSRDSEEGTRPGDGMVQKDERKCSKKRPIEECFEKTKKPSIEVKWVDRNKEREVEASGETNQHRQGTRVVRSNSTTRGVADATVSNGHWGQT